MQFSSSIISLDHIPTNPLLDYYKPFHITDITAWSLATPSLSSMVKTDYNREILHIGLWLHPFMNL